MATRWRQIKHPNTRDAQCWSFILFLKAVFLVPGHFTLFLYIFSTFLYSLSIFCFFKLPPASLNHCVWGELPLSAALVLINLRARRAQQRLTRDAPRWGRPHSCCCCSLPSVAETRSSPRRPSDSILSLRWKSAGIISMWKTVTQRWSKGESR